MLKRIAILLLANTSMVLSIHAAVITDLAARADAIVVGSIETRIDTQDSVSFDLLIERVIKGESITSPVHVNHSWRRRVLLPITFPSQIDMHIEGIWFLRRTAGDWDILSAAGPDGLMPSLYLPAVPVVPTFYQYSSSTSIPDKVVLEVAAALRAGDLHPETLLYALGSRDSPAANMALTDFLQAPNVAFRSVALASLLTRGKSGSVGKLSEMWSTIREDTSKSYVIAAIRDSFRDTTPSSVQQMVAIADTPEIDADLRGAVVHALVSIHSKEALPFLASLLSSQDPNEQMNAVIGLSSFANGCPMQTPANVTSMDYIQFRNPSPYRTRQTIAAFAFGPVTSERESELVAFWTEWWNQNRAIMFN